MRIFTQPCAWCFALSSASVAFHIGIDVVEVREDKVETGLIIRVFRRFTTRTRGVMQKHGANTDSSPVQLASGGHWDCESSASQVMSASAVLF